jgi:hypothetical protein
VIGLVHAGDVPSKMCQSCTDMALSWVTRASCLILSMVSLCQGQMVRLCCGVIGISSMVQIVVVREVVATLVEELHVETDRRSCILPC